MSLMAWFRRYNKKIMAIVVVALMIVFTIEPLMNYLSGRRSGGQNVVAHYGNNQKMTGTDLARAQQQLETLNYLGAGIFLRPQDPRYAPTQDLQTILLGELLFAERATGMETIGRIRQIVARGNYSISDKQINDIYAKAYSPQIYWLLLTSEAHSAGVQTSAGVAKEQLQVLIPRLAKGTTYEQLVGSIVARQGISEEQVLETFADLMSVLEYGRMMCSIQDRTGRQDLFEADWQQQTIEAEYVLFDSSKFAEQARRPSEEKITEQFEKHKGFFSGDVNEDNPYGFGYKQPERVQFEYIAVRLDDVAATVPRITQQEAEEFYQQHLSQPPIAYTARSDPNDPNSQMVQKTRSYAEVAPFITKGLYQQKVDTKAEQILGEAKTITEANLGEIEGEQTRLTDEQIKSRAIDYEKTAQQLTEKHKIRVYAGKTGLLSASDIQGDTQMGALYLGGAGSANVSLMRMAFAVEQLKTSALGPYDPRAPRLYENIGPLKDALEMTEGYSGKNMLLMRIIAAEKAAEPKSLDEKLDRHSIIFDHKGKTGEDTNSIKNLVTKDLKQLSAMDKTGEKANQFVQMAAKDGWDSAIDKFNDIYGQSSKKADTNVVSNDMKPFRIQTQTDLRKVPEMELYALKIRREGDPTVRGVIDRAKIESMLIDKLLTVLPDDANALANPAVVEFKPVMGYYCLKSFTVHQLYQEQYERVKARVVLTNGFADAQGLAAVHYNPGNILKRVKFILVKERQEIPGADANEANVPSGTPGTGSEN